VWDGGYEIAGQGTALQDNAYSYNNDGPIEVVSDCKYFDPDTQMLVENALQVKARYELQMALLADKFAQDKARIERQFKDAVQDAEQQCCWRRNKASATEDAPQDDATLKQEENRA
jgi:hypothetical protein